MDNPNYVDPKLKTPKQQDSTDESKNATTESVGSTTYDSGATGGPEDLGVNWARINEEDESTNASGKSAAATSDAKKKSTSDKK
jgi:hypothetical protein